MARDSHDVSEAVDGAMAVFSMFQRSEYRDITLNGVAEPVRFRNVVKSLSTAPRR